MSKEPNKKLIGPRPMAPLISAKGSLAMLAMGDLGLRKWRELRKSEEEKKNANEP